MLRIEDATMSKLVLLVEVGLPLGGARGDAAGLPLASLLLD